MTNFRLIQVNKLTIDGEREAPSHTALNFIPALKLYKMPSQARSIEMR